MTVPTRNDSCPAGQRKHAGPARRRARYHGIRLARWILTTTWFLVTLGMALVGVSLAASVHSDAWHWFQRSGAVLVSIGAILSTRRPLRLLLASMAGDEEWTRERRQAVDSPRLDSGEVRTCVCGFAMVALGTLVWAYGDLLGCLLNWDASCLP